MNCWAGFWKGVNTEKVGFGGAEHMYIYIYIYIYISSYGSFVMAYRPLGTNTSVRARRDRCMAE